VPYREPTDVSEPPDPELAAARDLHARAERIRKLVVVPTVLLGLAGGVVGYMVLREVFFAAFGAHQPLLTGVLGMLPPFLLSFRAAGAISDALVRRASPRWQRELAAHYTLDESILDDHVKIARGE
jgi:hypothetical protein